MKADTLLKLEDAAFILLSVYLFSLLPYSWWVFLLFFFAPDLSLLAMLAGKQAGALLYNVFHHRALAVFVYLLGALSALPLLSLVGVILLGHASFDRALGLGFQEVGKPVQTPPVISGPGEVGD